MSHHCGLRSNFRLQLLAKKVTKLPFRLVYTHCLKLLLTSISILDSIHTCTVHVHVLFTTRSVS